jgi:hypothetical protein
MDVALNYCILMLRMLGQHVRQHGRISSNKTVTHRQTSGTQSSIICRHRQQILAHLQTSWKSLKTSTTHLTHMCLKQW